jgi:phage shock protein A
VVIGSSVASTLAIGIPSVTVAVASYAFSAKANRAAAAANRDKVDADAYIRAKELYESTIAELRLEITRLKDDLHEMRGELNGLRAANRELTDRLEAYDRDGP